MGEAVTQAARRGMGVRRVKQMRHREGGTGKDGEEWRKQDPLQKQAQSKIHTKPGCTNHLSSKLMLLVCKALCLPFKRKTTGRRTTRDMQPLMINAHFTPSRSRASRVVLAKMSPPRPDPPLAKPWELAPCDRRRSTGDPQATLRDAWGSRRGA